jgi:hypothetical protein
MRHHDPECLRHVKATPIQAVGTERLSSSGSGGQGRRMIRWKRLTQAIQQGEKEVGHDQEPDRHRAALGRLRAPLILLAEL